MANNHLASEAEPSPPTRGPWGHPMRLLALLSLLAVPVIFFHTFAGMSWFDDEGTLMVGFRSLRDGHPMYNETYSLYGPFYNALYGLAYVVLRIPLTHTAGRTIAAMLWLGYTAGFARLCYRLTGSVAAMMIAFLLVLVLLAQLMASPGHPEEIGLLLMATILTLAAGLDETRRPAVLAAIGAVIAALALVKINFGAYVGGGVLLVMLRATTPGRWTRIAIPLVTAALLVLPLAVQWLLVDFAWVQQYIVFSTLTIGSALLVLSALPMPAVIRPADWIAVVAAGLLTSCVVIGGMMLAGSSAYAILNAVLLQNAHFIRNWYVPLDLGSWGLPAAVASTLAVLAWRMSLSRPAAREYRDLAILALKIGFVVAGTAGSLVSRGSVFPALTPFCWLLMVSPAGTGKPRTVGRRAAALVGAVMSLYPFPVAGDQIDTGALLPVLMIPILACDVLADWYQRGVVRRTPAPVTAFLASILVFVPGTFITVQTARAYWRDLPLGLPGTSLIRVDRKQAGDLRWVTAALSSCSASYSVPGLFSFTFWTGQALPTPLNINDVLAFIPPAGQDQIVQALSREPDLCIVYNPKFLHFFDRGQIQADPPLLRYLNTDFMPAAQRNGFIILRRRVSR